MTCLLIEFKRLPDIFWMPWLDTEYLCLFQWLNHSVITIEKKKTVFFHFVIGSRELWKNLFWNIFLLNFVHYTESEAWFFMNYTNHNCDSITSHVLAHCGLVTPYGKINLVQLGSDKQRVLMHGHQGWNVRHGLCHIYMIYVYIWAVYSFCLFCCLFIIVTTQFVALYKPCKPKPSTYDPPPGQPPPGRDPNSDT